MPKSDLIVLPGGFSYGDYLRSGAIAGKSNILKEVIKAATKLQKKIHPDMNRDMNTERLSQLVNEAKDKILKEDFN